MLLGLKGQEAKDGAGLVRKSPIVPRVRATLQELLKLERGWKVSSRPRGGILVLVFP